MKRMGIGNGRAAVALALAATSCVANADELIGGRHNAIATDGPVDHLDDAAADANDAFDASRPVDHSDAPAFDASGESDAIQTRDAEPAHDGEAGLSDAGGLLFSADFENGSDAGWATYLGAWAVVGGQYHVPYAPGSPKAIANGTSWFTDFTYEADVSPSTTASGMGGTAGVRSAGLLFRLTNASGGDDAYAGYYASINPGSGTMEVGRADNGTWTVLGTTPFRNPQATYHLKVVVAGARIQVFVGAPATTLKFDIVDATYRSGSIGVRAHETEASFDNLVVTR
jgi:hypothetical protein